MPYLLLVFVVLAACSTSLGGTAAVLRGDHDARATLGVSGRILIRDRSTHPTDDAHYFFFGLQPFASHARETGVGGGAAAELGNAWHAGRYGGAILGRFGYSVENGDPHLMFQLQATFELELGGSNWRLRDEDGGATGLCGMRRNPDGIVHVPERSTHHLIGIGPAITYVGPSVVNVPSSTEWLYGFAASYTRIHEPACLGLGP